MARGDGGSSAQSAQQNRSGDAAAEGVAAGEGGSGAAEEGGARQGAGGEGKGAADPPTRSPGETPIFFMSRLVVERHKD